MSDPRAPRGSDTGPGDGTPDLEAGGGFPNRSTPPESGGTSDVSEHEPDTRDHFPASGFVTIIAVAVIVVVFLVVVVGLILMATGVW